MLKFTEIKRGDGSKTLAVGGVGRGSRLRGATARGPPSWTTGTSRNEGIYFGTPMSFGVA
jgi:hypothetical protein